MPTPDNHPPARPVTIRTHATGWTRPDGTGHLTRLDGLGHTRHLVNTPTDVASLAVTPLVPPTHRPKVSAVATPNRRWGGHTTWRITLTTTRT